MRQNRKRNREGPFQGRERDGKLKDSSEVYELEREGKLEESSIKRCQATYPDTRKVSGPGIQQNRIGDDVMCWEQLNH